MFNEERSLLLNDFDTSKTTQLNSSDRKSGDKDDLADGEKRENGLHGCNRVFRHIFRWHLSYTLILCEGERQGKIRCRKSYQWLQETITMRRGERTTMSDGRIIVVKESKLHERGQRELKVVYEYSTVRER